MMNGSTSGYIQILNKLLEYAETTEDRTCLEESDHWEHILESILL